jgi:2-oxoisovalerate dehydrogenase E1 component alpha subunit
VVEERLLLLQRAGRLPLYVPSRGEEVPAAGAVLALEGKDWIFPSLREPAVAFLRGMKLEAYLHQCLADGADHLKGRQPPGYLAWREGRVGCVSPPAGRQIPQAVGFATAGRIRGGDEVVLVTFGDAAASQADFHAGMSFAARQGSPVIFLCRSHEERRGAVRSTDEAAESVAERAAVYSVAAVRVDGGDPREVAEATAAAARRARDGGGPTLLEARMASGDPLERLQGVLERDGLWNAAKEEELRSELRARVAVALKRAEETEAPPVETLFQDVFEEAPAHLEEQLRELRMLHAELSREPSRRS